MQPTQIANPGHIIDVLKEVVDFGLVNTKVFGIDGLDCSVFFFQGQVVCIFKVIAAQDTADG